MLRARRPAFPAVAPTLVIDTDPTLPAYSNCISLTALLPRKVETIDGIRAKDRSWKSVWCCLEGTSFSIYKDTRSLPSRVRVKSRTSSPLRPISLDTRALGYAPSYEELAAAYGPAGEKTRWDQASSTLTPVLPSPVNHRFLTSPVSPSNGHLSALPDPQNSKRFSTSSISLLYPPASPAVLGPPASPRLPKNMDHHLEPTTLIRQYSLQGAECGLASDYEKRAHVLRIRVEDEQFLLQLPDLQTNVLWIESIQTAIELSLDLDQRSMPSHNPHSAS